MSEQNGVCKRDILLRDARFVQLVEEGKTKTPLWEYANKNIIPCSLRTVSEAQSAVKLMLSLRDGTGKENAKACLDTATRDEQLRRKLAKSEEENKEWRERAAINADLLDALRSEFAAQPKLTVTRPSSRYTGQRAPRTLVLHLSDIHVGQLFNREKNGGLGEYSLEVFTERTHRLTDKVAALHEDLQRSGAVDRLVIVFNGDLVDGRDIHPGHDHQSVGMAAQLRIGPEVLAQAMLAPLAERFHQIDVFACPGNHGRIGKKGQLDRVEDSLDLVFMDILKLRCSGMDNINWHAWDKYFAWFELHGHTYFCAHGDAFKSWLNIPIYGAERYKSRIESLINRKIDVMMVGHHHSPANWATAFTNVVMNGSWVGTGDFGSWLGMGGAPTQKMVLVSDDFACATVYDLILADKKECLTAKPVVI